MFKPNDFSYEAGQAIDVYGDHFNGKATFSLISSPNEKEIEIMIKETNYAPIQWIVHKSKVGDFLRISPRHGNLKWPIDSQSTKNPVLLIGGGIGIAPMISIIQKLIHISKVERNNLPSSVTVIHQATSENELILSERILPLESHLNNSKVIYMVANFAQESSLYKSNTITDENTRIFYQPINAQFLYDLKISKETLCYLCGPPGFVNHVKNILQDQLHIQPSKIVL